MEPCSLFTVQIVYKLSIVKVYSEIDSLLRASKLLIFCRQDKDFDFLHKYLI